MNIKIRIRREIPIVIMIEVTGKLLFLSLF